MQRTGQTSQEYQRLLGATNREFFKTLFHVEHRDLTSRVIPFELNSAQSSLDDYVRRVRDLELRRQIDAARAGISGPAVYIDRLLSRLEAGEQIYDHEIGFTMMVGKSRRGGISTYVEHLGLRYAMMLPHYDVLVMAHDEMTAKMINEIPRLSYNRWPARFEDLKVPAKKSAELRFSFLNGSEFTVRTAGQTRVHNEKTRGWKFNFLHLSEYAHYTSFADVKQIEGVKLPHHIIIKESTANGAGGPFYNEWQASAYVWEVEEAYDAQDADFFQNWNGQYKFFFSWLDDPGLTTVVYEWERTKLEESLDDYEQALIRRFPDKCTLERIKWRRDRIRAMTDHDRLEPTQLFMQEYPADEAEMFQSTGQSVFDQGAVEVLLQRSRIDGPIVSARVFGDRPPKEAWLGGANFWMYEKPKKGAAYVLGADVGHGVGKDDSVAVILDRCDGMTYREVAAFRDNTIDPKNFGHVIVMMAEMYNEAFVMCEAGPGPGIGTHQTIVEDNRYGRVYRRQTIDMVMGDRRPQMNWRYGFWTSQQAKYALIGDARPIIKNLNIVLRSGWGVDQIRNFEEDERGRLGRPNVLDDYVIALCLAIYGGKRAAPSLDAIRKQNEREEKRQGGVDHVDDNGWWPRIQRALGTAIRANRRTGAAAPAGYFPPADDDV